MSKIFDRIKQATLSSGTGVVSFSGSEAGYLPFSQVLSDNQKTYYVIEDNTNSEFEVGLGTYSGSTLSRDVVYASTNSNNLVSFSGNNNTFAFITYPATGAVYVDHNRILTGNYTGVLMPDGFIQTIAYTGQTQDLSAYDTIVRVDNISGNLQTQITNNDSDITSLQTATGLLDLDIQELQSNTGLLSSDIQALQTATGLLDSDVQALQTATGLLDSDVQALQTATIITVTGTGIDLGYGVDIILCDASSNDITVNLPKTADSSGVRYDIKKIDTTANEITITPSGSETIDNETGFPLLADYSSVTLVTAGSGWWVI